MLNRFFFIFTLSIFPVFAWADAVSDLIDVPGSKWRERPALTSRMEKHTGHEPMRITIHFTDIHKNLKRPLVDKLRILFKNATKELEGPKKKLWGDIPYHYYIDPFGKLGEARNPQYQPDSNTAYVRDGHITVVLEGNERDGISIPQKKKLFELIQALQEKHRVPTGRVSVHK